MRTRLKVSLFDGKCDFGWSDDFIELFTQWLYCGIEPKLEPIIFGIKAKEHGQKINGSNLHIKSKTVREWLRF